MTRPTAVLGAAAGSWPPSRFTPPATSRTLPTFKASALLPPAALKGPHFKVEEAVTLEGLHRRYRITSDYGAFDALGDQLLATRLKEVEALARLADTSEAEVALKAVGGAVGWRGQGSGACRRQPRGDRRRRAPEASGRCSGASAARPSGRRRRARRRVKDDGQASPSPGAPSKSASSAAADATGDVAKSALGVSAGRRRWAKTWAWIRTRAIPSWPPPWTRWARSMPPGASPPSWCPGVGVLSMVANVNNLVYSKSRRSC
jgi:hypothetical protein